MLKGAAHAGWHGMRHRHVRVRLCSGLSVAGVVRLADTPVDVRESAPRTTPPSYDTAMMVVCRRERHVSVSRAFQRTPEALHQALHTPPKTRPRRCLLQTPRHGRGETCRPPWLLQCERALHCLRGLPTHV